jgi:hypothetical protein
LCHSTEEPLFNIVTEFVEDVVGQALNTDMKRDTAKQNFGVAKWNHGYWSCKGCHQQRMPLLQTRERRLRIMEAEYAVMVSILQPN